MSALSVTFFCDYPIYGLALLNVLDRDNRFRVVSSLDLLSWDRQHCDLRSDLAVISIYKASFPAYLAASKIIASGSFRQVVALTPVVQSPLAAALRCEGASAVVSNAPDEHPQLHDLLIAVSRGFVCTPSVDEWHFSRLTRRECAVLVGLLDGLGVKELALLLKLSPKTVSLYKSTALEKTRGDPSLAALLRNERE
ncbi:LuxR C-terminal-related transcriptional regulator [Uliginosibacterium sp. sgz301328]|uniref:helix-turn-helix transcriptional regulator n=1 Tax=Uliginosibacterium sp. sgz301328 TaxID=3243764 RepID=UPI00359DAE48